MKLNVLQITDFTQLHANGKCALLWKTASVMEN